MFFSLARRSTAPATRSRTPKVIMKGVALVTKEQIVRTPAIRIWAKAYHEKFSLILLSPNPIVVTKAMIAANIKNNIQKVPDT